MAKHPPHPRVIAKHLREEVNRFDRSHPEWREETKALRTATAQAIGFLEAFAAYAAFAEGDPLERRDG